MNEMGWEEGPNVRFQFYGRVDNRKTAGVGAKTRGAEGQPHHHLRQFRSASSTAGDRNIPIVGMSDDMVGGGLVVSMARPGGKTTGISIWEGTGR